MVMGKPGGPEYKRKMMSSERVKKLILEIEESHHLSLIPQLERSGNGCL
jgi:hypothetical protein